MIEKLFRRFIRFPFFIQLTWLLCLAGTGLNAVLIVRDLCVDDVLLRLHIGFFILYAAQLVFILVQEKYVSILTLLQGVLALCTTADFIFVPVLQIIGRLYYWLFKPTVQAMPVYEYVFSSAAFTLQLAVAAYLWFYFYKKAGTKPKPSASIQA